MVTRAFVASAAIVLLAGPAFAKQIPTWNIADICRDDSAPGQCTLSEAHARNTIGASWDLLPTDVRDACIAATRALADQSWRILAICIEGEVLRARAERTIATGSTPAEPGSVEAAPSPADSAIPDDAVASPAPEESTPAASPGSAGQQ